MGAGLVLQHEPSGPPALFADWLEERAIPFEVRRAWEDELPAEAASHEWICSLGSDQTPGRPGNPEWVEREVEFLRTALAADVPVLGLCFGGQALATAAGARVVASDPPEVGWRAVETHDASRIPAGPWLHFHYDQLLLPSEATELARSPAGTAAFALGPHLALQFHPEATPAIAASWVEAEATTLERLGIDPARVVAEGRAVGERAAASARDLFDAWWSGIGAPARR